MCKSLDLADDRRKSWALESGFQLKESEIAITIKSWIQVLITRNTEIQDLKIKESEIQNLESGIHNVAHR